MTHGIVTKIWKKKITQKQDICISISIKVGQNIFITALTEIERLSQGHTCIFYTSRRETSFLVGAEAGTSEQKRGVMRSYSQTDTGQLARDLVRDFVGVFVEDFVGNFLGDLLGNYIRRKIS